jgi:hypothetical protein
VSARVHTCFNGFAGSQSPGIDMRLNHEFAIVECQSEAWKPNWLEMAGVVTLDDDLLRYVLDSLAWFPSVNASTRQPQFGLNTWGLTVITADGATVAGSIFRVWAQLFALSPARLKLRGAYGWTDHAESEATDPPATRGAYQRLEFERDDVCASLLAIAAAFDKVSASDGHLCVLHKGV